MNSSTVHYTARVMLTQIGTGVVAFGATALLAPLFLRIDLELWASVVAALAKAAALAILVAGTITALRLRSHRFALRALSLRSESIDAADLRALDALPASTTLTLFIAGALASAIVFVPDVRPETLDDGRTASLVVLAFTLLSAAAIPHYVLARRVTLRLVELSPIATTTALVAEGRPRVARRIRRRILVSVATPVLLVGAGAVLLAHSHLRAFLEESRKTTAIMLARAVLDSDREALSSTADQDAIRAAKDLGFTASIKELRHYEVVAARAEGVSLVREADGSLTAQIPLENSRASVRFSADPPADAVVPGVLAALLATLVAAALGFLFGREVSRDLDRATARVQALAGQGDLRTAAKGSASRRTSWTGGPAASGVAPRFDVVERLEEAVETLTDRFRVFAAAQERALVARETAQRVRGLLFASVSHDLKSPLNAILGFADLLDNEDLTPAQAESLHLIQSRGRELLGLIETILDAARVEAGQLKLSPRPVGLEWLVSEAARKAVDLLGEDLEPPIVEIAAGLPSAVVDPTHGARAVAVIVAHALRTTSADPAARAVRIDAHAAHRGKVGIDVLYGSKEGSAELGALAGAPNASRARGLILSLSLSRRIIELHGGEVAVGTLPDGRAVCHILFPAGDAAIPPPRPSE